MKAVLLLLPGMLNDASLWDAVAAELRPRSEVRVLPTLAQDSVPAMAQAAWARLADLPAAATVVLAGFSLGGYVALEMLARPARAVQAAVFVSTSARPETPEGVANREKTIAAMQADFPKVVDGILKWGTHEASAALLDRLRSMMLGIGAETAIRQNRAILARADHRAALAQLRLPVTVVCGRQDRITPPTWSEELAALIPGAALQWVDQAGHMLPAEQPQALAALLSRALPSATSKHTEGDPS